VGSQQLLAGLTYWPEVLRRAGTPVGVLYVLAAIPPERWAGEFERNLAFLAERGEPGGVTLELASADPPELTAQLGRSQVVCLRGGTFGVVRQSTFAKLPNLGELLRGKVVAASSAGAYILARYCCTSQGTIAEGLGLVPCKVLAHYHDGRAADLEALRRHGAELPVYALREDEYVTLEVVVQPLVQR